MQAQTLEKPSRKSPLLSEPVIERDYTQGIESQIDSGGTPTQEPIPETPPTPTPPPDQGASSTTGQQSGFDTNFSQSDTEGPKGFSFEEPVDDASDVQGDEAPGFEMASGSAKTFANVIGDLIKVKVPEVTFNFCKVDTNSIEKHIANGNINPSLREVFHNINGATFEALQFSDDEIKMWKKAFKEYLEYKNIKTANPETAFWIATGTLVVTQGIKTRELSKNNKQYIVDAINSYNPEYFDTFRAKKNEEPEAQPQAQSEQPSSEPSKTKTGL